MSVLVTLRPGVSFEKLAAESWARMERDKGEHLDVNRSTVDRNVQLKMFNDWNEYRAGRRPKPNHGRAIHPDYSWHCLPRARAADTDDDAWIRARPEYGWRFVVSDERWHAQYYPELDLYKGQGVSLNTEKENDMIVRIRGMAGRRMGGLYLFKDGKRTFLGADGGEGFPLITDESQIGKLFRIYPE